MKPLTSLALMTVLSGTMWVFPSVARLAGGIVKAETVQVADATKPAATPKQPINLQQVQKKVQESPQLQQQAVQLLQQNPELVMQLVQQVLTQNPQLIQQLVQNPQLVEQIAQQNPLLINLLGQNPQLVEQLKLLLPAGSF